MDKVKLERGVVFWKRTRACNGGDGELPAPPHLDESTYLDVLGCSGSGDRISTAVVTRITGWRVGRTPPARHGLEPA